MNRKLIYLIFIALVAFGIWRLQAPAPTAANQDGKALVQVNAPELTSAGASGKAAFDEKCAVCHGTNAAGVDGSGPPLIHRIYEPNHHGDGAFFSAAINGVRAHHWKFGNMPPVEGITKEQVQKIVTYVREVQKFNNIF